MQALEHNSSTTPLSSGLSTASVILDAATGFPLLSVGELLAKVADLGLENSKIRSEIAAQGGTTFDAHTFTSESVLEKVLVDELPSGGLVIVELFLDINILLCHHPNVDPGNAHSSLTWNKATKDMAAKGYAPAARKAVRLFHEAFASLYTDGKEAIAGHKIAAFKTKGEWMGEDGCDGCR